MNVHVLSHLLLTLLLESSAASNHTIAVATATATAATVTLLLRPLQLLLLQVFTLNRRVQAQNRAPDDFPGFIREGFDITIVGEGYQMDPSGYVRGDYNTVGAWVQSLYGVCCWWAVRFCMC